MKIRKLNDKTIYVFLFFAALDDVHISNFYIFLKLQSIIKTGSSIIFMFYWFCYKICSVICCIGSVLKHKVLYPLGPEIGGGSVAVAVGVKDMSPVIYNTRHLTHDT